MRRVLAIVIATATFAGTSPAWADAIDGEWCSKDGKNLEIDGPAIRTPAGLQTSGRYSRHAFAYEPPDGDPEKGQLVVMELIHEELMRLMHVKDGVPGEAEEWRRCNVTS